MLNLWAHLRGSLNFFRIHILFFTFTPLVFSGIFYASNGEFRISYVDSLFLCVSAMTVTGLATVDLSALTGWQQAILFIQSCLGTPVLVSWVMVYMRKKYFAKKFEHIVEAELARRAKIDTEHAASGTGFARRITRVFSRMDQLSTVNEGGIEGEDGKRESDLKKGTLRRLRPEMIRRMDDAPKPVDPNGWISQNDSHAAEHKQVITASPQPIDETTPVSSRQSRLSEFDGSTDHEPRRNSMYESHQANGVTSPESAPFNRTHTVEFRTPPVRAVRNSVIENRSQPFPRTLSVSASDGRRHSLDHTNASDRRDGPQPPSGFYRSATMHTYRSERTAMDRGYGGFPGPQAIFLKLFRRLFPETERRLVQRITIPRTVTIGSQAGTGPGITREVPYITFDAIVGRNSKFHMLTEENLEELGGVEFRALNALLWIVGGYHILVQLICFVVIAPYISAQRWRSNFEPPQLHRYVPPSWYAAFQVVSAYTNSGLSLVDQSMIPFQKAYPMIIFMVWAILAGNTAFPIFLRFTIWIMTKFVPAKSRANETLHFLLDHPRRCFIYLFPSHQTWFLLTILVILNATDWFCFLVLDIGNPEIERVPLGTRFVIGLLQASAVRAAGFGTVSLSALAPGVQVLYVMMMYISVYPIAMSVRSTNVYEERSLGVFEDESELENEPDTDGRRVAVWGRYLAWHARKQLAFDMWWLGLALFLVCIVERHKLQEEANFGWFTIFSIVFELISAYGTVGLSLGVPYANYSLSGAFAPLSKLIVCAVMLRGRHRGLPVAIDRAIMLPFEFGKSGANEEKPLNSVQPKSKERPSTDFSPGNASTAVHEKAESFGLASHPNPNST
ncbi:hypothetical protein BD410DRAFT_820980 [Rickenella mellea]|uniref:Potassium transport protein n=1 Tax=Rickenella mellea TaxID=50990 RepID=A0A4Y7Q6D5_9AGAM|nr:hypothetical protein BD410DRAFT_820980 [Rickenella mellea]